MCCVVFLLLLYVHVCVCMHVCVCVVCQVSKSECTCESFGVLNNIFMYKQVWIWICTLQGPFLAIFAMELGERNANIKILLRKDSLCGFILQSRF